MQEKNKIDLLKEDREVAAREKELFAALDKGIDDMEQGRTVSHEDAMKLLREKVAAYHV